MVDDWGYAYDLANTQLWDLSTRRISSTVFPACFHRTHLAPWPQADRLEPDFYSGDPVMASFERTLWRVLGSCLATRCVMDSF